MNTENEDRDMFQSFDPFPQPQTIPAGWDLSALLSTPQVDSDQQAEDSTENESN
jgi:hypothetical protein